MTGTFIANSKYSGTGSMRAHAERYGDDLMSRRVRHFLHRHRLRHVTATLAENAEHYLHGNGRV